MFEWFDKIIMFLSIFKILNKITIKWLKFYSKSDILGIVVWKGGKKMSFIENIKQRAKQDIKTIILPEAEDKRVFARDIS